MLLSSHVGDRFSFEILLTRNDHNFEIDNNMQNVAEWIVHMWSKRNNWSNPETRNIEPLVPITTTNNVNDNQINRIKHDFNWTDKETKTLLEIIPTLMLWILLSRFLVPFHVAQTLWNTFQNLSTIFFWAE